MTGRLHAGQDRPVERDRRAGRLRRHADGVNGGWPPASFAIGISHANDQTENGQKYGQMVMDEFNRHDQ